MKFNCEKLDVYRLSRQLIVEIYKTSERFPASEKFGLTSQIRRSAVSVCLNIAEGSGKWSKRDFANFIRTSIGSLIETDTALKISQDLHYIDPNDCEGINELTEKIYYKLIALNKSLTP
jgi:four helix bundle protein